MTHQPLTKAQRDSIVAASSADGYYAHAISRLCADLDAAEAERDDAVALIDAAKSDVRPESFLEHAQAILAKCIAPYSCEQMKAVGDALAGCYRKWELMSEVALKAKEDADSMAKCKGCGGTVGDHLAPDQGGCPGSFEIDGVQMVPLAGRDNAVAQRDRAEAELAAERRMRVEADAASDRLMAERDALIRNINDAFLSLNIPNSTMAFDGRNLLPHAVESARYAEEMRIERDKALADVAKYVDRSESFASAIDHLVSNTADGTDLARITKERDDFRDGMVAMLVAAGAPVDLDAMEAAVLSAGKKPSDFISQRIRVLTAERDAMWMAHRDVVDERDALKAQRDSLHARLYPQPCKGCPGCSSYADCPDEIDRMTTERDALKARLAALVEACDAKDDMLACCRLSLDSLYADLRQERGE